MVCWRNQKKPSILTCTKFERVEQSEGNIFVEIVESSLGSKKFDKEVEENHLISKRHGNSKSDKPFFGSMDKAKKPQIRYLALVLKKQNCEKCELFFQAEVIPPEQRIFWKLEIDSQGNNAIILTCGSLLRVAIESMCGMNAHCSMFWINVQIQGICYCVYYKKYILYKH